MRTSPRLLETHGGTERDIVIAIYMAGPGKRTETLEGFEDPTWLRWLAGENGGLFIVADPAASVRMGARRSTPSSYCRCMQPRSSARPSVLSGSAMLRRSLPCRLTAGWLAAIALTACAASPDPGFPGTSGPARGPGRVYGVVVVGDFGVGSEAEHTVSSRIRAWTSSRPFDAFVTVGDNVYDEGDPAAFPEAWNAPYGWIGSEHVPVVASLGNHDVRTDDGEPVMALLGMPDRWYRRVVGSFEFFVLDANDPANESQLAWLKASLASSTSVWTIAVFHQPAYSCGQHGSTAEVQQRWVGLFEQYDVDLVLNGHDHDYQRFAPINGITYIVTGGGGAGLYEVGDCPAGTPPPVAYNDEVHHFVYVSATKVELKAQAVADSGRILDSVVLTDRVRTSGTPIGSTWSAESRGRP